MNDGVRLDGKWIGIFVAIILFAVAAAALVTYRVVDYRVLVDTGLVAGDPRDRDRSTPDLGPTYDLGVKTVNLATEPLGGTHYLRAQLVLEAKDDKALALVQERQAQVWDRIISMVRSRTMEDIDGEAGLTRLRGDLVGSLNEILPGEPVRNLYFVDLVVQ
ncbi:flagellar basal body-associated FliL family protein [Limnochorda pilosa]|uniref:Flagellar protein FliL n=1 Tax=Limnochorda pilosa TaxID=1555112 RepID=A0A0K2SKX8_LIMPI|nr:flagellar basal body-associated FliL family protein [Limnochorda pilosa]BAS27509.1 hypothetical protein LIP_1663 [Limnochorda pilosa]